VTDQVETLSEQVPDGTLFFWIDIPFGKDLEPEKVGKPEGTLFVVLVLEALILLHGSGIGKMYGITGLLQSVDQPVPVERRMNYPAASCEVSEVKIPICNKPYRMTPEQAPRNVLIQSQSPEDHP